MDDRKMMDGPDAGLWGEGQRCCTPFSGSCWMGLAQGGVEPTNVEVLLHIGVGGAVVHPRPAKC